MLTLYTLICYTNNGKYINCKGKIDNLENTNLLPIITAQKNDKFIEIEDKNKLSNSYLRDCNKFAQLFRKEVRDNE